MLLNWVVLCLLVFLPISFAGLGKRTAAKNSVKRVSFYLKDIIFTIALLGVFFILSPTLYFPIDFSIIPKGIVISEGVLSGFLTVFFIPFVLSFTSKGTIYPENIFTAKELFGWPLAFMPNSTREYLLFVLFILSGVLFEELIFRQFMFTSFNNLLHLAGDKLVLASSLLFSVAHLYQGWKGIISNFLIGLLLGKIFLVTESLAYPIVLHMALNSTLIVLAAKRLRDLKGLI